MKSRDSSGIMKILLYAPEKAGFLFPDRGISETHYQLSVEAFGTAKRFNEYDGVIIFQGIFESFKGDSDWRGETVFSWFCHRDELDRRKKETELLLQKGGFVCFLLWRPFVDRLNNEDISNIDLTKVYLRFDRFYRASLPNRVALIQSKRSEFDRFLKLYGAAHTTFSNNNEDLLLRPLATFHNKIVGMVIGDNLFYVPVLLPSKDHIHEFISLLIQAIIATRSKLVNEIPEWAEKYIIKDEAYLNSEKTQALEKIEDIDSKLRQLDRFKTILVHGDENLVDSVSYTLKNGFGINVNKVDEFREDLKILDDAGDVSVLCEIKGVNRGVTREHINQTDNHRERAGLPPTFPAILIINTNMKNARSIEDKNQDIAGEQVSHAKKMNVLILRTIDLLRLLHAFLIGRVDKGQILQLLSSSRGWLKVGDGGWELKES